MSFRAVATLLNSRDALPGDNEFISFPSKVTGKAGKSVVTSNAMTEEFYGYVTDTVSNPLGIEAAVPEATIPEQPLLNEHLFIPVVIKAE